MPAQPQRTWPARDWVHPWLCVAILMAQLAGGGTRAWATDGGPERTAYSPTRALGYDDSLRGRANIEVGVAVLFKKGD
jgi:hypothetical protein